MNSVRRSPLYTTVNEIRHVLLLFHIMSYLSFIYRHCVHSARLHDHYISLYVCCGSYSIRRRIIQYIEAESKWHFPDDIFKCIFLNENVAILSKISMKFVPKGPIDNNPPLVLIMAWHRTGDKPLSEPIMAYFTDTYMCHSASMS